MQPDVRTPPRPTSSVRYPGLAQGPAPRWKLVAAALIVALGAVVLWRIRG